VKNLRLKRTEVNLSFDSEGTMKSGFPGTTVYNCLINLLSQLLTVKNAYYSGIGIEEFLDLFD
jgi:hypothetical protein